MGVLKTIISMLLGGSLFPKQMTITDNATYDYIIAGGGTAGCVLTKALIDANYTVLLLESGGDPPVTAINPAQFYGLPTTSVDHDYTSVLDAYAAGGQGNHTRLTSGDMLGGSSSLNHLLHIRGQPKCYDNWAKQIGDESWSYDNLLKYFIKSENLTDSEVYENCPNCHGINGPTGLSRQTHDNVLQYLEAFEEDGHLTVLDLNANGTSSGYTQPLLTIGEDGTRQTTATTYLKSVKDNPNLYVSKKTIVSKVIIENNVAVGVEAIYKNVTYTFRARKEVIVSAGAFNTPQILMLSGIGPKDHLESLNISVVADLPVGENLIVPPAICLAQKTQSHSAILPTLPSVVALGSPTELPFSLFVGSTANYQSYNLLLPYNVPLLLLACTLVYGYKTSICTDLELQVTSRDALFSVLVNFDVKSRGSVRLNSKDPTDAPMITTGFYNNEDDLDSMLAIVRNFTSVQNTTFFQKIGAATVGLDLSECADYEADSDKFWRCFILNRTISPFLYMGSCAIGTVVDSKLKVKSIDKLRVVDASVFVDTPCSATNAAVLAVAEKAADMILNDA